MSTPAPALPAPARVRARRARWYRQPTLMAGLVLLAIILFMCYGAPLLTSFKIGRAHV